MQYSSKRVLLQITSKSLPVDINFKVFCVMIYRCYWNRSFRRCDASHGMVNNSTYYGLIWHFNRKSVFMSFCEYFQNRIQSMPGDGEQIAVQSMERKWGICGIGHERNTTSKPFVRCYTCRSKWCCHVEQLKGEMKCPNIQQDTVVGAFVTAFETTPEMRQSYEKTASNTKRVQVYESGRQCFLAEKVIWFNNFDIYHQHK